MTQRTGTLKFKYIERDSQKIFSSLQLQMFSESHKLGFSRYMINWLYWRTVSGKPCLFVC